MLDNDLLSDLDQSKITGFTEYSTYKYEGFTETLVSEIERILRGMQDGQKTQNILEFFKDLQDHLDSREIESFDPKILYNDIIQELFSVYRSQGYHGTITDMLQSLIKLIDVGDDEDTAAGISDKKAVHARAWKKLMDEHLSSDLSHYRIKEMLDVSKGYDTLSTIHTGKIFKSLNSIHWFFRRTGSLSIRNLHLDKWSTEAGTLSIRYTPQRDRETYAIIKLIKDNDTLEVNVTNDKLTVSMYPENRERVVEVELPLNRDILTEDRVILSYKKDTLTVANLFDVQELPFILPREVPLFDKCNFDTYVTRVDYYPMPTTNNALRFLLN